MIKPLNHDHLTAESISLAKLIADHASQYKDCHYAGVGPAFDIAARCLEQDNAAKAPAQGAKE